MLLGTKALAEFQPNKNAAVVEKLLGETSQPHHCLASMLFMHSFAFLGHTPMSFSALLPLYSLSPASTCSSNLVCFDNSLFLSSYISMHAESLFIPLCCRIWGCVAWNFEHA